LSRCKPFQIHNCDILSTLCHQTFTLQKKMGVSCDAGLKSLSLLLGQKLCRHALHERGSREATKILQQGQFRRGPAMRRRGAARGGGGGLPGWRGAAARRQLPRARRARPVKGKGSMQPYLAQRRRRRGARRLNTAANSVSRTLSLASAFLFAGVLYT
jgi:hypothetical protein